MAEYSIEPCDLLADVGRTVTWATAGRRLKSETSEYVGTSIVWGFAFLE
jgi:hypothetical protein